MRPLVDNEVWEKLSHTPYPPKKLLIRGLLAPVDSIYITIVGSRVCSEYGRQVVDEICKSLEGQPVSIISGLAHGIDTQVHKCALKYKLHTIAVVGSGVCDKAIYPQSNLKLAYQILDQGGALITEQDFDAPSRFWMFPARNRITVGMSQLVIIIEAKEKSGTLITSRLATDYNRDVLVVPHAIYSSFGKGSNELIKQGAYMYTKPSDVFELLKLDIPESMKLFNYIPSKKEKVILDSIKKGFTRVQDILDECSTELSTSEIVQILQTLEIEEVVKKVDGEYIVL